MHWGVRQQKSSGNQLSWCHAWMIGEWRTRSPKKSVVKKLRLQGGVWNTGYIPKVKWRERAHGVMGDSNKWLWRHLDFDVERWRRGWRVQNSWFTSSAGPTSSWRHHPALSSSPWRSCHQTRGCLHLTFLQARRLWAAGEAAQLVNTTWMCQHRGVRAPTLPHPSMPAVDGGK